MQAQYDEATLSGSNDTSSFPGGLLRWFGVQRWKDLQCKDWECFDCNNCVGHIALHLAQNNGTRTIHIDGGTPMPALIQAQLYATYNRTSFYFEDPNQLGGWAFSCGDEEAVCIDYMKRFLHLVDEATYITISESLTHFVYTTTPLSW